MKKISCPMCSDRFTKVEGLYAHMDDEHSEDIPDGYTPARYVYLIRTRKDHGSCVICKTDTEWNESTGKYSRFCSNPKCKDVYKEQFRKRMMGKYGKTTLLNDPEQQKKMLANRHISGEYEWSDGSIKTYTGTYELDFLKMLDVFMNFDSNDIITPSPHTYYYIYEGEKKFYIPDAYIPSLNLEIEIKDGGNNPNNHPKIQQVDKVKEKLKDDVMKSIKGLDYIKISNKNYDPFFLYLLNKKTKNTDAIEVKFNPALVSATESLSNYTFIDLDEVEECDIPEDVVTESLDKEKKYGMVFLILTKGKTPIISDGIRHFTKSDYTHASIAFRGDMAEIYSYNFKGGTLGFVKEDLGMMKDRTITVFGFFTDFIKLAKMKAEITDFNNNKTKYDFRILAVKMFNLDIIVSKNKYKQVCSTFVDTVLKSGDINLTSDKKLPAPSDIYEGVIKYTDTIFQIYNGPANKYNVTKVKRKLYYLSKRSKTKSLTDEI